MGSRSLFVWLTDAWHLAQTIETLAWLLAMAVAIRLGYKSETKQWSLIGLGGFLVIACLAFYSGFLLLYGWLLVK